VQDINEKRKFRSELVDSISTIILTTFDAHSWDFLKNNTKWQEHIQKNPLYPGPSYNHQATRRLRDIAGRWPECGRFSNSVESCGIWSRQADFHSNFPWKSVIVGWKSFMLFRQFFFRKLTMRSNY
jgi:hypothetical protein